MTQTHVCGVCGHEIDPELEQYSELSNTLTGKTYDYICSSHNPFDVVGATMVTDGSPGAENEQSGDQKN